MKTIKEKERDLCLENAELIAMAPDMFDALRFVQKSIAEWRDGSNYIEHPEHGLLNLEEVKYLVVDPIIEKLRKVV